MDWSALPQLKSKAMRKQKEIIMAPRTSKQVLADQARQAERDRKQLPVSAAAMPPAPTTPDTRTDRERYLDEIAPSGVVGRLIKFTKDGFIFLDTEETIGPDENFVALCDQTLISYVRFHDGEPPTRIGGLLYAGFRLPSRDELGDTDRTRWPLGLSGQHEDPWKHEIMMVL